MYDNLHWGWVAKGLAEVTFDDILRREIDLLEQLGGDGDATGCSDLPQGRLVVHVCVVQMVIAIAVGVVFLQGIAAVRSSLGVLFGGHLGLDWIGAM